MISILLADDHGIIRKGIKLLIEQEPDMSVLWETDNQEKLLQLVDDEKPDVVVTELYLEKKACLHAINKIKASSQKSRVIVLTNYEDKECLFRVLKAGASGFLLKTNHDQDLIEAIRTIYHGGAYLYPNATKVMLDDYVRTSRNAEGQKNRLTAREEEVLSYIAKGYTNREIAEKLYVSVKTIEAHRAHVMDKLNLRNRPALVQYAMENGLVHF
ncbi:response regulator [Oceanobacillus halotolerans]|uniref:response regulator n=1 Tax=Oceanobacillus halotolerans TaxID=2663380 RepID=UPI0013DBE183|nr:response regulator transcription factor [Oceanobacillus halotolerans]